MPKVHTVKSARKPIPARGIEKGDTYYWWSFRVGRGSVKKVSKTYPKPSQLTNSDFLSQFYAHQEAVEAEAVNLRKFDSDKDAISSYLHQVAEEVRNLGEEQEEKRSAMEDAFPGGCPTMELLEQRYSRCEEVADELESVAYNIENAEPEEEECEECCGSGTIEDEEDCPACGNESAEGEDVCGECDGYGLVNTEQECPNCAGAGTYTPEAITDSQRDELADEIDGIDWSVE